MVEGYQCGGVVGWGASAGERRRSRMPVQTRPFDRGFYLGCDGAIAIYWSEARDTGGPVFVVDAVKEIARGRQMTSEAPLKGAF
jgi:hypothetical protein